MCVLHKKFPGKADGAQVEMTQAADLVLIDVVRLSQVVATGHGGIAGWPAEVLTR